MDNYTILIFAFLILIFIGLIHRSSTVPSNKKKETFGLREPPHFLRRAGLCPTYCPFRDQY
jgi:hypothetical protein